MKLAHRVVGILYLLRVSDGGQSEVCEEQGQGVYAREGSVNSNASKADRQVGRSGREKKR